MPRSKKLDKMLLGDSRFGYSFIVFGLLSMLGSCCLMLRLLTKYNTWDLWNRVDEIPQYQMSSTDLLLAATCKSVQGEMLVQLVFFGIFLLVGGTMLNLLQSILEQVSQKEQDQ